VTEEAPADARRRVRRGESEVTEWPRGLVDYVPSDEPERAPSPEEDRDLNRLKLAARLLGSARAQGRPVEAAVARLRQAERAFREGDRTEGRRLVGEVIDEVDRQMSNPEPND